MDKKALEKFNDNILNEIISRYDMQEKSVKKLIVCDSIIYTAEKDKEQFILRIGHNSRKSSCQIQAEVDWINYLQENGADAAKAILSQKENLIEVVDDGFGGLFIAVLFEKAKGNLPLDNETRYLEDEFEIMYGQAIGKLHRLTKNYIPVSKSTTRKEWDHPKMMNFEKYIPKIDTEILAKYRELISYLNALPKNIDSYGLIHFDAHWWNFFIDEENKFTFFDFEECNYNWFMNDIAMVFFYNEEPQFKHPNIAKLYKNLLIGYSKENKLDPVWLKEIPYFFQLREFLIYSALHREVEKEASVEWCTKYIKEIKNRIDNNIPWIDFDFESLAEYMCFLTRKSQNKQKNN